MNCMLYLECALSYHPDVGDYCEYCQGDGCDRCDPDLEIAYCEYCGGEYTMDYSLCTCET